MSKHVPLQPTEMSVVLDSKDRLKSSPVT